MTTITFVWHTSSQLFYYILRHECWYILGFNINVVGTTCWTLQVRQWKCYYHSWRCIDRGSRPVWIRGQLLLPLLLLLLRLLLLLLTLMLYDGPFEEEREYSSVCKPCFLHANVSLLCKSIVIDTFYLRPASRMRHYFSFQTTLYDYYRL